MVVVFFGKRNSGKTTLCRNFYQWVRSNTPLRVHYIDNDKFRYIFNLKSMDKKTEVELLEKASTIAKYEQSLNDLVLVSMSFAYENLRKKLTDENKVLWVYTQHNSEHRPTNKKDFEEFELPKSKSKSGPKKSSKDDDDDDFKDLGFFNEGGFDDDDDDF